MHESRSGTRALELLTRIGARLSERDRAIAKGAELTSPQVRALRVLLAGACDTPAALARLVGLTPSTVTGIIDRLERAGLVRRSRVEGDRRKVTLVLTEAGRVTAERLPLPLEEVLADAVEGALGEQTPAVLEALARLEVLLTTLEGSGAGEAARLKAGRATG